MAAPVGIRLPQGRRVYLHVKESNVLEYSSDLLVLKWSVSVR
jgi:hypothetical protein